MAVLTAAALRVPLASRLRAAAWTRAAILVSAGALLGDVLSRGPGLPDYDDDLGAVLIATRHAQSRSTAQLPASTLDSPDPRRERLGQTATISSGTTE